LQKEKEMIVTPTPAGSAENRSIAYYHQDGLLDIFIGWGVFMIGLFWFVEMPWLGAAIIAPMVPAWKRARERITFRRLGGTAPSDDKYTKPLLLISLVGGLLLLVVVAGVAALLSAGAASVEARAWLGEYLMLILAGLCALVLLAVAAGMQIRRYYLYATLIIAVLLGCQLWNAPISIYWIAPGLVLMAGGGLILLRFLRSFGYSQRV
jgi:hypothetical protein